MLVRIGTTIRSVALSSDEPHGSGLTLADFKPSAPAKITKSFDLWQKDF